MGPYPETAMNICPHSERMDAMEARIKVLEDITSKLDDLATSVDKIARYIKFAAPSILSAALAAGLVNGKLGDFLRALLGG